MHPAETPPSPWRRPLFITAGLSLLALGAAMNLTTMGSAEPPAMATVHAPPPAAARKDAPTTELDATLQGQALGETYGHVELGASVATADDAKSTFAIDVDTAAYANVRRFVLSSGELPPADAVRTEELINYFDYAYPEPEGTPFSVTTEIASAPWNPERRLLHIGIQGRHVDAAAVPPRNLVFLVDVSGSMAAADKLPLLQRGLADLAAQMTARDRISLVVYAGAAGTVLEPTSGADQDAILDALRELRAGGSTNGAAGIEAAYDLARAGFIEGGINRVIIATDGDFNVGTTDHDALIDLIAAERETGVSLSVLGFGRGNLDDHLMEQLADTGDGNYAYIDGALEAHKVLVEEVGAMLQTIAKDVKIQVEFDPSRVARHRLIGYENRVMAHEAFADDARDGGEIGVGHTVTALYELELTEDAADDPLGTLSLRHQTPQGGASEAQAVPVVDAGLTLDDTSDAYRFSAAVAMFGQKLRGSDAQADIRYADIVRLASGALGEDPSCYRHQFLEIAAKAGDIAGETIDVEVPSCTPPHASDETFSAAPATTRMNWGEMLRLVPPLLALPMFALAFWRPRRRRRT